MSLLEMITATLTDNKIVSSIASTVFIILLGFFCRKKGIFNAAVGKMLSKVVLTVALPALAFNSFMQDINPTMLKQGMNVLIWGVLIYIILIFISKPFFLSYNKDKQDVLRVLTIFGSTTFFGIPIVGAIYGPTGVMYSSIFNIGYRIFLYSYGYIKMSGLKMELKNLKTMFLNPIVIATFLYFVCLVISRLFATDECSYRGCTIQQFAFLRIDQTAVWLFKPMTYLAGLASPLAWLSIGSTLGRSASSRQLRIRPLGITASLRFGLYLLLTSSCCTLLTVSHILSVDSVALATIVIMMATPTATVAAAYAISFDKEAILTSNASLLSTITSVVMIPVWIITLNVIDKIGIF